MLLTATFLALCAPFQASEIAAPATVPAQAAPEPEIGDASVAGFRVQLLDLAVEIASSLPVRPHVKDRSRELEAVAASLFELDQPVRALECVERIPNWRRGTGYADYAFYCAQKGALAEAERYIAKAVEIAAWPEEEFKQAWRRDRIRAKIARTYVVLGRRADAARFTAGLLDSEWGQVEDVLGAELPTEQFDAWFKQVDEVFGSTNMEKISNALSSLARMHGRFYADEARRAKMEHLVKINWVKVPAQMRFEIALVLAENALGHADAKHARELIGEARLDLSAANLNARTGIALAVRFAELSFKAGDAELARAQVDAALATFYEKRATISETFRAETVIPVAESFAAMGSTETAVAVYELAVAESIVNPNSRPRAEDLGAVCRSMAVHGVEPSDAIWSILHEIAPTLGHEYAGY
jgi:tetratricopeptide (TPR) repeat protein